MLARLACAYGRHGSKETAGTDHNTTTNGDHVNGNLIGSTSTMTCSYLLQLGVCIQIHYTGTYPTEKRIDGIWLEISPNPFVSLAKANPDGGCFLHIVNK